MHTTLRIINAVMKKIQDVFTTTHAKEFQSIQKQLTQIKNQLKHMATREQFAEGFAKIDAATNAIAAKITGLEDIIKGAGLEASVEEELLAQLNGVADQLTAIGSNPENPTEGTEVPPTE